VPLTVQDTVLAALREMPLTADELQVCLGRNHASVGSAIHVLKAKKLIVNSGICRLTRAGRPAVVWRATDGPAPEVQDNLGIMPPLRWRCK